MALAGIVLGFAIWGIADFVHGACQRLDPWLKRCGDNIARRLSPCPVCEGWGSDPNDPGAYCPRRCAAARRVLARMEEVARGGYKGAA